MRLTILFGGLNRERLVSTASAQAVSFALPEADIWFWDVDGQLHEVEAATLENFANPFETPFASCGRALGRLDQALDRAQSERRLFVLALHGGAAENGEFQAMCERRAIPFTGSGSASSHLSFDKIAAKKFAAIAGLRTPANIALEDLEAALADHGKLVAKPAQDGSSYGLIFVNGSQDLVAVRAAARNQAYVIEPCVAGPEATCGVLETPDGTLKALAPVEIIPADGAFDYNSKYLAKTTQEICPARFAPEINAAIMDAAILAHRAMSCRGYSRSDFIISSAGPVFIEINTLPGLTKNSLYPKALNAEGIAFIDFLTGQIALARNMARA